MHSPSRKGDVESATIASSTNQADTHRATQYSYTPSNILNIAFLISIIALFYVSGAATVVSLQQLMQTHPHPFLWCGVQFLFSYVLSAIYFWIQGAKLSLPTIEFGVPLAAAVCYALGLVFSNIALEYGKDTNEQASAHS